MRRQISILPAVALMAIALLIGLIGGGLLGGLAGYHYASQSNSEATVANAAVSSPTSSTDTSDTNSGSTSSNTSTQSTGEIVAAVNPAVVTIVSEQRSDFGPTQATGTGTGMIIDTEGHIVTNNHVVDGADSLEVIFSDGERVSATLVGSDPYQDVAVIKVDAKVPATITFGDSDKVKPGDSVIAIGSALGEFRNTVTDGIVSATGRSLDTGQGYRLEHLIQHDAPINPGNSGGPLINMSGEVIGMNTAIVRGGFGQPGAEGLGFAIESNTVKRFAEQIIAEGRVERPYLGISFRPVTRVGNSSRDSEQPVLVMEVASGSPADKAGLRPGDVITAINGTTLDDEHPFLNVLYAHKPGDKVTLTVQSSRGSSQSRDVEVTLGSQADRK
ncbi:trypsin-like peptidase domain-containing protein [Sphaerobacter sp.]|uniref:S1C family serine protease n=1 Tax=Sphaerobacter sp. TaxID=2099654 RepID=UPI001DF10FBC|nr:trypsin-like peptidase domain-containing protein [Sphaerobacter sp.]MBX5445803.1 trypsin-like peptidase domain-containing protein [Sphaerobacter sp.]